MDESRDHFNMLWKKIHSLYTIRNPRIQLRVFFSILLELPYNCPCRVSSRILFYNIIQNDTDNFVKKIVDYNLFWIFFHNLINIKLNKAIFVPKITEKEYKEKSDNFWLGPQTIRIAPSVPILYFDKFEYDDDYEYDYEDDVVLEFKLEKEIERYSKFLLLNKVSYCNEMFN